MGGLGGGRLGGRGHARGFGSRRRMGNRRVGARLHRARGGFSRTHMRGYYHRGFIRGGYYRRGRYRYAGPVHHVRYTRWRRVHNYHVQEVDIDETNYNYDSFRAQLPPDGPNFRFVPMSQYRPLDPALDPQLRSELESIRTRLVNARSGGSCPCPLCLCALFPVIGWIYCCCVLEDTKHDNMLDRIGDVCTELNLKYAQEGVTIQYIDEDPIFYGFTYEVNPYNGNGDPNPKWQGAMPQLSQAEIQNVVLAQQVEQGKEVDEDAYLQNMEAAATEFEKSDEHYDSVDSVAHNVVLFQLCVQMNQSFQPFLWGAQAQLQQLCTRLSVDMNTALMRANSDWTTFSANYQFEISGWWTQVRNSVDPTASQLLAGSLSAQFLDACALPPPPVFDPNAPQITPEEQKSLPPPPIYGSAEVSAPVGQQFLFSSAQQQPQQQQFGFNQQQPQQQQFGFNPPPQQQQYSQYAPPQQEQQQFAPPPDQQQQYSQYAPPQQPQQQPPPDFTKQ